MGSANSPIVRGVELSGMAAARANAAKQVRELRVAMCHPHIQDLSGWSMTVLDAKKNPVFTIGFDGKARPKNSIFLSATGRDLAAAALNACGAKGI
jgi:hypothetical protein